MRETEDGLSTVPRGVGMPRRVCLLIRPGALPGASAYFAGAFVERSTAEAVRATLPVLERARAEIRELDVDELRPRPQA